MRVRDEGCKHIRNLEEPSRRLVQKTKGACVLIQYLLYPQKQSTEKNTKRVHELPEPVPKWSWRVVGATTRAVCEQFTAHSNGFVLPACLSPPRSGPSPNPHRYSCHQRVSFSCSASIWRWDPGVDPTKGEVIGGGGVSSQTCAGGVVGDGRFRGCGGPGAASFEGEEEEEEEEGPKTGRDSKLLPVSIVGVAEDVLGEDDLCVVLFRDGEGSAKGSRVEAGAVETGGVEVLA